MIIEEVTLPKPREFVMRFTTEEGWVLIMALRDAHDRYAEAVLRDEWQRWSDDLDKLMRS